jgi:hypothetical protein
MAKKAKQTEEQIEQQKSDDKLVEDLQKNPMDIKLEDTLPIKAAIDTVDGTDVIQKTIDKVEEKAVEDDPEVKETFDKTQKLESDYSDLPNREKPLETEKKTLLDDKVTDDDTFNKKIAEGEKNFKPKKSSSFEVKDFSSL